jgi:2-keto-3-deoxy-L-fuconate dehydrogenase
METRTALITCVDRYMGGAIKTKFEALGIKVIGSNYPLESQDAIEKLVSEAGKLDIIVANFAEPPMTGPVQAIDNSNWQKLFAALVDPLMYLVRAATPGMLEQKSGKIIAITSAAPLKGIPNNAAYCAARGAQNGFIKAVGLELARSNIQVNAIAQNYINNDTYYPDDILETQCPDQQRRSPTRNCRIGRLFSQQRVPSYGRSDHPIGGWMGDIKASSIDMLGETC